MRLILLALLFCTNALADISLSGGVGKGALERTSFERVGVIGYELGESYWAKAEIGGWMGGEGISSWWYGVLIGVRAWVPSSGFYISVGIGPVYLSTPDNQYLSGHLQFAPEFAVGIKNDKVYSGIKGKHLSDAGLDLPNIGRDFLMIEAGIHL